MHHNRSENMGRLNIEPGEGGVPHRLYDLSIEDIQERRERSVVIPSATDAMNYLGVPSSTFYNNRGIGKSVYSIKFERRFAIRVEMEK